MVEFYVQCFFAAALYPAFLMLLNAVGGFLMLNPGRARNTIGWICLAISAVALYTSLAYVDSVPTGIAIHLIASCVFFILFAQVLSRLLKVQPAHQKAFVYSAILIIQPLINLGLLHYLGASHFTEGFLSATKPDDISKTGLGLLSLLELGRWILTLLLALYYIFKQKAKRMLPIAIVGLALFGYWFHLWATGELIA